MKKTLFILSVLFIVGCATTNEPVVSTKINYTDSQLKVFAMFIGTFADTQYTTFYDPDKLIFGANYSTPISFYRDDYIKGKVLLFESQGECTYCQAGFPKGAAYTNINCYYNVNKTVDILSLYYNGGNNDKTLFRAYALDIISSTKFTLQDPDLTLPYIFVKQ